MSITWGPTLSESPSMIGMSLVWPKCLYKLELGSAEISKGICGIVSIPHIVFTILHDNFHSSVCARPSKHGQSSGPRSDCWNILRKVRRIKRYVSLSTASALTGDVGVGSTVSAIISIRDDDGPSTVSQRQTCKLFRPSEMLAERCWYDKLALARLLS
jgi:hypothetical protein